MAKVTLETIDEKLELLIGQLKLQEPIPATGPITMNKALQMTEQDEQLSFTVRGRKIYFTRKLPFGEQKWPPRPLVR